MKAMHKDRLISLAMIVRNAAGTLERVVENARDYADEVVICDTGSTDGTPGLAAKLGCRVVAYKWSHNFAAARNSSFRACRCSFVVWLDPDELVAPGDGEVLREAAARGGWDEMRCRTYVNGTYRPPEELVPGYGPGTAVWKTRAVRRCPEVRWRYRVHEDFLWSAAKVARLDSPVRVLNYGNATDGGEVVADYYRALMVIGLRESPGCPHYALYLAEWAMTAEGNLDKAGTYLDAVDPGQLGGEEQVEKLRLLRGRLHKARALLAVERGDGDTFNAEGKAAMAEYREAHKVKKGSRGPLEAATFMLAAGQRERFDAMLAAVLKEEPGNLQAAYMARLSGLERDAVKLNRMVAGWHVHQGKMGPAAAFGAVVGARGTWRRPVRVRVVVPARVSDQTPQRRANLSLCLRRLRGAGNKLREEVKGAKVEVVLVEQAAVGILRGLADGLGARHLVVADDGPFNRGRCFNAGVSLGLWEDLEGLEVLVLMDGDLAVGEGWLVHCLGFIAGWQEADLWRGAMLPYVVARYLREESSEAVRRGAALSERLAGDNFASVGGMAWVERALFDQVGGFDECYVGWGSEDRDFHARLERQTDGMVWRVPDVLWHLYHEKPDRTNQEANRARFLSSQQGNGGGDGRAGAGDPGGGTGAVRDGIAGGDVAEAGADLCGAHLSGVPGGQEPSQDPGGPGGGGAAA